MDKKRIIAGLIGVALIAGLSTSVSAVGINEVKAGKTAKNVILLIPDGMSTSAVTLTRWYNGGTALNLDSMASGLIRTYSSDAAIADSAPAGTAMATGYKSHTGYVGVLPDENTMPGLSQLSTNDKQKPVATILEAAKLDGKATGLVATSEIMHATPADFSAHYPSRKNYNALSEQEVYQNVDVVIGAGSKYFTSAVRDDKEDLISEIKSKYQYVTTLDAFKNIKSGKLWAMFNEVNLAYEMDRDETKEPSLAEMTQKSIDLLSQDKDGFFLMVEGSKIDWAAHANDPIGIISDVNAFDDAVGIALDYAKKDGNTVVIAATDHGNSGMTIGNSATSSTYDKLPLSTFIDPLKKATLTGEGIESKLNEDRSNIVNVMAEYYGISDLTADEIKAIKETAAGSMNYTVGPMIAKRASIGFTTTGHTGEDVTLYTYVPSTFDQLTGTVENTDIAKYMEKVMGVSLADTTNKLFVEAEKAFTAKGAAVSIDRSNINNPVITVTKDKQTLIFNANKDYALINGVKKQLKGVIVDNGTKFYVSQDAVNLL